MDQQEPLTFSLPPPLGLTERAMQWLVLTVQFLLKKDPDLHW